jgi:hypothetical protein
MLRPQFLAGGGIRLASLVELVCFLKGQQGGPGDGSGDSVHLAAVKAEIVQPPLRSADFGGRVQTSNL